MFKAKVFYMSFLIMPELISAAAMVQSVLVQDLIFFATLIALTIFVIALVIFVMRKAKKHAVSSEDATSSNIPTKLPKAPTTAGNGKIAETKISEKFGDSANSAVQKIVGGIKIHFDGYSYTDIGGKKVNEDSVRLACDTDSVIAVLADGLGSHGGGDIASAIVVNKIFENFKTCENEAEMTALFAETNEAVLARQKNGTQMKSTLVSFRITDEKITFIHAGDSRGYIFRNGEVFFQTFDHSIPQMEVLRGNITPDMIRFHHDRNKVLRALGIHDVNPEISKPEQVLPGDAYLICSDGFWEYVNEPEMLTDLAKSTSAEAWITYMLERIAKRVHENNDNLSAVAVICT
jgi:serine/threonine protein phosphatase PrpC/cbb3-type cytochrome oxidase subunit 3